MESYFQTWNKLTFNGRATRTEYWSFFLINNAIAIILSIIGISMGWSLKEGDGLQLFLALFSFVAFVAYIPLSVRRLHDINLSGWWGWLFIPLGLPMIIVGFIESKDKKQVKNIPSPQNSTSNFKSENVYKSTQSTESSNDDALYEQAMTEIEEDTKVRGIWAKALANSDGNIDRAKSMYIQMRVQSLKIDNKSNVASKPDSEKIQEFSTNKLQSSECNTLSKTEQEKNFLIKFYNGEFLLWKTFFITFFILIIIGFLQAMLYDLFSEKLGVLITIDIFFYIIIFILLMSSWNSATLQSYISFTFWTMLVKAILFIFFLCLFGLINESIKLFLTI